ncbi:histidine kinase [Arboricoccus pini]|nr:histidine kinase [Arboricoccus pini]
MPRRFSLRAQLVLIPTLVLLLALGAAIAATLSAAQDRIDDEVRSSMELGKRFAQAVISQIDDEAEFEVGLRTLESEFAQIRHAHLVVLRKGDMIRSGYLPAMWDETSDVPLWFYDLVSPPLQAEWFPIVVGGRTLGYTFMISNPLDEVTEIWEELSFLAALLVGLSLLIIFLLYWAVRRALKPLDDLAHGFDALEQGQLDTVLPPIRLAELEKIGLQFNSLAARLKQTADDNHLLIDRLMWLQEAERKELARELHDSFGPTLFGIRTDVAAIRRLARQNPALSTPIQDRTQSISETIDIIQKTNYRLLEQLRPLILDELGLFDALEQLVASWRERMPEIDWQFVASREQVVAPEETAALHIYRIVQESLTNIARHARASSVIVTIATLPRPAHTPTALPALRVTIADNGIGRPETFKMGFGLLGMAERVRLLGGQSRLMTTEGGGTMIDLSIPIGKIWSRS